MRKRNKFGAKKVQNKDGLFDSMGEFRRWQELKALEKFGQIKNLERLITFKFVVNDVQVSTYKADFKYEEPDSALPVVEEFKGFWTPQAKLKARLFKALYGSQYEFRVSGRGADTRI